MSTATFGFKAFILAGDGLLYTRAGGKSVRIGDVMSVDTSSKPLLLCHHGIHYCHKDPFDCFGYYDRANSVVARVEILGKVIKGDHKCCTSKLLVCDLLDGPVTSRSGLVTLHWKQGKLQRRNACCAIS